MALKHSRIDSVSRFLCNWSACSELIFNTFSMYFCYWSLEYCDQIWENWCSSQYSEVLHHLISNWIYGTFSVFLLYSLSQIMRVIEVFKYGRFSANMIAIVTTRFRCQLWNPIVLSLLAAKMYFLCFDALDVEGS